MKELEAKIIEEIKTIFDPEIPVNIYELGLIYEIKIDDDNKVNILMTLTSPNCPVADSLPIEVQEKVKKVRLIKQELGQIRENPFVEPSERIAQK